MKRTVNILSIVLLSIILMSFSYVKRINIITQFVNIDEVDKNLLLDFEFRDVKNDTAMISPFIIEIYNNDTLVIRIVNETNATLNSWQFPTVPNGFKIDYPKNIDSLPEFKKTDNLSFSFKNGRQYGQWVYNSYYADSQHRWMFDNIGKQITFIKCTYEPWIGKDIISVETSEKFQVIDSTFRVLNEKNELVDFKLKYKRNPTNKLAITLNKKEKKGKKMKVRFKMDNDKLFEGEIIVPDKSLIGIAGKYGDL